MTDKKVSELVEATDLTGATFLIAQGGASKKAPVELLLNSPTITTPTISQPTLTLKQATAPTPTAEGDIRWDTDDDILVVGDGSGQKYIYPERSGTWTPGISFGGGSVGITYTKQVGIYRRVGKLVWLYADITLSSKGSSTGAARVTGVPFPTQAGTGNFPFAPGFYSTMASMAAFHGALFEGGNSTIDLFTYGTTASSGMSQANFNAGTITLSGMYLCA